MEWALGSRLQSPASLLCFFSRHAKSWAGQQKYIDKNMKLFYYLKRYLRNVKEVVNTQQSQNRSQTKHSTSCLPIKQWGWLRICFDEYDFARSWKLGKHFSSFSKFWKFRKYISYFFPKFGKNIKNIEYEYFPKEEAKYDAGRCILILNNDEVFLQPRFTDDKAKERRASNSVSLHPFSLHFLNLFLATWSNPSKNFQVMWNTMWRVGRCRINPATPRWPTHFLWN